METCVAIWALALWAMGAESKQGLVCLWDTHTDIDTVPTTPPVHPEHWSYSHGNVEQKSSLFCSFSLPLISQFPSFLLCGLGILSKQRCYSLLANTYTGETNGFPLSMGNPGPFHRRVEYPVFHPSIFTLCIFTHRHTVSREENRKAPFVTVWCPHCSTVERLVSLGS